MPEPEKKTEPSTPAVETLQNLLQEKESEVAKYQKLMQDPSMQLVLEKMSKGEDIVLADQTTPEAKSMKELLGADKKPEALDIDSLSNTDLVGVVSESVEQYVGQVRSEVAESYQKEIASMKSELVSTQEQILKMAAQDQVKSAESKYDDFETYRPEMQKAVEKYPNMSIDDLYTFTKGKHVLESPGRHTTESEKPESSSPFPTWDPVQSRSPSSETKELSGGPSSTALRSTIGGRKDFANFVGAAAQRLLSKQNL